MNIIKQNEEISREHEHQSKQNKIRGKLKEHTPHKQITETHNKMETNQYK